MTSSEATDLVARARAAIREAQTVFRNPSAANMDRSRQLLEEFVQPLSRLQAETANPAAPGGLEVARSLRELRRDMRRLVLMLDVPYSFLVDWNAARSRGYDSAGTPVPAAGGQRISLAG